MIRNKKIIIILFAIVILLTGVWLSLDSYTKNSLYRATLCKLIYGKNICNFYAMMDIANYNSSIFDFNKGMNLCKEMTDVPKKDGCFEYIAEVFARIDIEKAQLACNEIKGFGGVKSKEDCHSKISKIQEINENKKGAIKIYLEENIWKPNRGGKTFCAYEILGEEYNSGIHQYVWALCEEYYLENKNNKLQMAGGTSLPVALILQRENNIYKVISHEVPGNGSFYGESIKRIFPKDIQNKIFSDDVNYHNQRVKILQDEIKKDAESYFDNPCSVCINGCDVCPEGCDECLIGIEKKSKDPNLKWYYSPEGSQKFNEMTIPVFANDEPETVVNSILQTLNDSSFEIKFSEPEKSFQWWISDDSWNINDPNAISIASPVPSGGGHRSSVDPLDIRTRELEYFISRIFLANDFAFNVANTSEPETENDFYDYAIAFQKGETRCTLKIDGDSGQYTIACSDRFQEAYDEQTPYLKVLNNRNAIVSVKERIGDFVWLNVHGRRTGFLALVKDEEGEIKLIFTGQESPPCDLMIENQVPKEVYRTCYDVAGNIVQ